MPRTLVEQQVARPQTLGQLGRALDVHFLYRGNVTRSESGHALELAVIDVATERVLHQRSIKVEATADGPQLPAEAIRRAAGSLTYFALTQEVARARDKPEAQLDTRDLAFRAKVDWNSDNPDRAAVYAHVMQSLNRARALAPDDLLTLQLTAQVNLCECLKTWAVDNRPMEEIGVAALDRYLTLQPESAEMLGLRYWHCIKRGRYREALLVNDTLLAKQPDDADVLLQRVIALRSTGELEQALALVPKLLKAADGVETQSVAAAVYFAHGDDAQAALLSRKALVHMTRAERVDSALGVAALVLAAAESRAGRLDQARRALQDFQEAVPNAKTIGQIKAWLQPSWVVPGGDAFWQALQNAGVAG